MRVFPRPSILRSDIDLLSRSLLVAAMLISSAVPALANYEKEPGASGRPSMGELSQRHPALGTVEQKLSRDRTADPYWTPCDYTSSYGTNSCE